MDKKQGIKTKEFLKQLKEKMKPHYAQSLGVLLGLFVLVVATFMIFGIAAYYVMRTLSLKVMMLMYGMTTMSSLILWGGALILIVILYFMVMIFVYFFQTAIQFKFQDIVKDDNNSITIKGIFAQFKQLRKSQLLRLFLWIGLFTFLWQLPFSLVSDYLPKTGALSILTVIIRLAGYVVACWKGIEYSQALYLYREKQPSFLGQSMRHAITASRRFMGGRKWKYLWLSIVMALPVLVWAGILGGVTYWGIYTWTPVVMYLAPIILVLGLWAYLPVIFVFSPLFYELNKDHVDLDSTFKDTFKALPELKNQTTETTK
jgi:hypothetical protein